jgi:hypothetical protein
MAVITDLTACVGAGVVRRHVMKLATSVPDDASVFKKKGEPAYTVVNQYTLIQR